MEANMFFIGIVLGIANAIIANNKGFSPVLWFFGWNPIAFISILIRSGANKEEDIEKKEKMIKIANKDAKWLIFLNVLISLLYFASKYGRALERLEVMVY